MMIGQRLAASRQHGLAPVALGHGQFESGKSSLHPLELLVIEFEGNLTVGRHSAVGEVIIGRSETSRGNDDLGPLVSKGQMTDDVVYIIGACVMSYRFDSQRGEAGRQELHVAVQHSTIEQLVTDS
jgi:hypothetical protein